MTTVGGGVKGLVARAQRELVLIFAGQLRDGPDLLDVSVEGGG